MTTATQPIVKANPYRNHPQYLMCSDCGSSVRIEFTAPTTVGGMLRYCPACGSNNHTETSFDSDLDYWYALVEGFGLPRSLPAVKFLQGLYEMWDVQKYRSFRAFIEAEASEVLKKVQAANAI